VSLLSVSVSRSNVGDYAGGWCTCRRLTDPLERLFAHRDIILETIDAKT